MPATPAAGPYRRRSSRYTTPSASRLRAHTGHGRVGWLNAPGWGRLTSSPAGPEPSPMCPTIASLVPRPVAAVMPLPLSPPNRDNYVTGEVGENGEMGGVELGRCERHPLLRHRATRRPGPAGPGVVEDEHV